MKGFRCNPTINERIWAAIRQRKTFTQAEIAADTRATLCDIQRMAQTLVRSGHLRTLTTKPRRPPRYELIRDTGPRVPIFKKDGRIYDPNLGEIFTPGKEGASSVPFVYNGGLQRAWQAMRILGTFDAFRIAAAAEISYGTVRRYVRMLARVGYLRLARKGIPGRPGNYHTYQLTHPRHRPRRPHLQLQKRPGLRSQPEPGLWACGRRWNQQRPLCLQWQAAAGLAGHAGLGDL